MQHKCRIAKGKTTRKKPESVVVHSEDLPEGLFE